MLFALIPRSGATHGWTSAIPPNLGSHIPLAPLTAQHSPTFTLVAPPWPHHLVPVDPRDPPRSTPVRAVSREWVEPNNLLAPAGTGMPLVQTRGMATPTCADRTKTDRSARSVSPLAPARPWRPAEGKALIAPALPKPAPTSLGLRLYNRRPPTPKISLRSSSCNG